LDHRCAILEAEAQHADREAQSRHLQQDLLNKFLNISHYRDSDCEEMHKLCHRKILPHLGAGSWLLERHEYLAWRNEDSSEGATGLFWRNGQRQSVVLTPVVDGNSSITSWHRKDNSDIRISLSFAVELLQLLIDF
jgi:hypothetical protein